MGYRSDFQINATIPSSYIKLIKGRNLNMVDFIIAKLREISGYRFSASASISPNYLYAYSSDTIEWYAFFDNMEKLSNTFPGIIFYLTVDGEDPTDLSEGVFQNGRGVVSRADVSFWNIPSEKEAKIRIENMTGQPSIEAFLY